MSGKEIDRLIEHLGILIVDANPHMRRLTRIMLTSIGAKSVSEAADGLAALDHIRQSNPDVMLVDWEIPVLAARRSCTSSVRRACSPSRIFP